MDEEETSITSDDVTLLKKYLHFVLEVNYLLCILTKATMKRKEKKYLFL
jgi:hypothetical protein